jgi:hypothetical protein
VWSEPRANPSFCECQAARADRAQDYGERGRMFIDTEQSRYLVGDVEKYIYW